MPLGKIKANKIRCKLCGDVIESKTRHDFVWCKCGACAVDGGHDYTKRAWSGEVENPYDIFEELTEYYEESK